MTEDTAWPEIFSGLLADGYQPFRGNPIDRQVVADCRCERCDGLLGYRPVERPAGRGEYGDRAYSYRAFAVCGQCGAVEEF